MFHHIFPVAHIKIPVSGYIKIYENISKPRIYIYNMYIHQNISRSTFPQHNSPQVVLLAEYSSSCLATSQGGRACLPKGSDAKVSWRRQATASAWHSPCKTLRPRLRVTAAYGPSGDAWKDPAWTWEVRYIPSGKHTKSY
jgi:hypothetical protein